MTNTTRSTPAPTQPNDLPDWHTNLRFLAAVTVFLAVMLILGVALVGPWLKLIYYYIARSAPGGFERVFVSGEFPNLGALTATLLLVFLTAGLIFVLFKVLAVLIRRLRPLGLVRKLVWVIGVIMLIVFFGNLIIEAYRWLMVFQ